MLQANPSLTPNAIKAILQYTAEVYPGYDALTQGAGFVNAKGAVELAAYLAAPALSADPSSPAWSRHIIWGQLRRERRPPDGRRERLVHGGHVGRGARPATARRLRGA